MKWALILSGGGSRGLAHVGALQVLESWGVRPDMVVGSSAGALVGACWACGMPMGDVADFLLHEFDLQRFLDRRTLRASGGRLLRWIQRGEAAWCLLHRPGIDSGCRLHLLYRRFTGDRDFSETRVPFACNAVDLLSGREVVLDRGRVADALRAATSLPGLFEPVPWEGMLLVDGGLVNHTPVWIARRMGARRALVVQVNGVRAVEDGSLRNGVGVLLRASAIAQGSQCLRTPGIPVLEVTACDGTPSLDFSRKEELIRLGERAVWESAEAILRLVGRRATGRGRPARLRRGSAGGRPPDPAPPPPPPPGR